MRAERHRGAEEESHILSHKLYKGSKLLHQVSELIDIQGLMPIRKRALLIRVVVFRRQIKKSFRL
ncbi:MAG: hypothetical protein JW795_08525 [Chitinivibrionales bacterium]|nr:hypothetical protein [Chitinivibrionales bacterium]